MAPPRRNPYPGLIIVASIPALLLGGLWRMADARQPPAINVSADDSTPPEAPGVMSTPLLSVRRAPSVLSNDTNMLALKNSVGSLVDVIDDTSCLDVAINGEHLAGKNETLSLRPASNVKLITAAVALEVLGPTFTYTTTVTGDVGPDGVVTGDLYLVGGGDPVLGDPWWNGPNPLYPEFNMTYLESLADSVVAAGVRAVQGRIVGDASRYDNEWFSPTWTEDLHFFEGGPISALLANDSRESLTKASNDPVIGAANVFTDLLVQRGVLIANGGSSGIAGSTSKVASVQSSPLPLILAEMLTTSDNNTAEMVLKELGVAKGGGGTRLAGLDVVNATLKSWGIPMDGVTIVDGSGLSDDNRLTCAALMAVLQHGSIDDPVGQGLAVGGQKGGTLVDAFDTGPLAGVIRGKTGTLYNYQDGTGGKPGVKALSGYIPIPGGGEIEYAMLLNGPQIGEKENYRPIWDTFATVFGTFVGGPSPTVLAPR